MTEPTDKNPIIDAEIYRLKSDVQCMQSCLANGLTLQGYIDIQQNLIKILQSSKGQL